MNHRDKSCKPTIRLTVLSVTLGFLFALCIVFGYQLEHYGNVTFRSCFTWLSVLGITLFAAFLIGVSMLLTDYFVPGHSHAVTVGQRFTPVQYFGLSFICLFLCWIPSVLGLYPGYFEYDAVDQWLMVANHSVTTHHPVLHTLLLGGIVQWIYDLTGSFNKGVFLYTLIQLGISGLCFSYVLTFLYTRNVRKGLRIFSFIWFTAFPTVILNLFSTTKDSIFAPLMLVFLIMTAKLMDSPEHYLGRWYRMIPWILITFLMTVMRNNAVYVTLLFLILLLLRLRMCRKRLLAAYMGLIALYLLYAGPFCSRLVSENLNTKEYLSVPLQQVIRVYKNEYTELSPTDRQLIESVCEPAALYLYNPKISDAVKNNVDLKLLAAHRSEYLSLWWRLAKAHPETYLNSFLENTYGFWYPKATLILSADGTEGYFFCQSLYPAEDNSKLPLIYDYYGLFHNSPLVQGSSPVTILFAPGTYFFLLLYVLFYCIYKKRTTTAFTLCYVILFWLTFLLGPVALVRYTAFLYYLVPLEACILFDHNVSSAGSYDRPGKLKAVLNQSTSSSPGL